MLDRYFPRFHARPRTGWVNDPNGIGVWDGAWHVMCQHNPHGAQWGNISWAHLSSTDLVTWTEHPLALVPHAGGIDADGAWSGVAVMDDGEPALVYTAVPEGGAAHSRVSVARRVGEHQWEQTDQVATGAAPTDVVDVRDPFVFTWQGRRFGIQGGGTTDGVPLVLLYDAEDLDHWRELGTLLRGDDPVAAQLAPGRLWECPQLVELDGEWLLVLSLWDDQLPGSIGHGPQHVAWLVGDLVATESGDRTAPRFVPRDGGSFDDGTAFYAPQIVAVNGRALAWGWIWEGVRSTPPAELPARDWAGCVSFPRVLSLVEGRLRTELAPEVHSAFEPGQPWPGDRTLPPDSWIAVVNVDVAGEGETEVVLSATSGDRELWRGRGRELTLTFDGSVFEAFTDGRAETHRFYPAQGDRWTLHAVGDQGGSSVPVLVGAGRPDVGAQ